MPVKQATKNGQSEVNVYRLYSPVTSDIIRFLLLINLNKTKHFPDVINLINNFVHNKFRTYFHQLVRTLIDSYESIAKQLNVGCIMKWEITKLHQK